MKSWPGFLLGAVGGGLATLFLLSMSGVSLAYPSQFVPSWDDWLTLNLGSARWLFLLTLGLYGFHLVRLRAAVAAGAQLTAVARLDQLVDVWVHMFLGIGVVWTAIGMRSALQSALSDADAALTDSAGNVLQALVEGGILLALTTTIVGGVGGYLMKLGKALAVGADLQNYYAANQRSELRAIVESVQSIEHRLALLTPAGVAMEQLANGPVDLGRPGDAFSDEGVADETFANHGAVEQTIVR